MNAEDNRVLNAYSEVPYPGVADAGCHLRRVEALGRLHGLDCPDIANCRVLELGAAAGNNLLPQAIEFPESRFLGIDLCDFQVAEARTTVQDLELGNIEFRQASILDIDDSWGEFDYIICAGVYSWVPPDVQQGILDVCRHRLAPHGAAVVSFNSLPGWHFQNVVRDLMRFHVAAIDDPQQKIRDARSILEFVSENIAGQSVQGRVFHDQRDTLRTVQDSYFYHDYLVDVNRPVYLQQFVHAAESSELQFVCDTDFAKMSGTFTTGDVQQVLARTPLIQQCQLLDFLRNESFHQTVLCHGDVRLKRTWTHEDIQPFALSVVAKPQSGEDTANAGGHGAFVFPAGRLTTREPLGHAALTRLVELHPEAIPMTRLVADTLQELAAAGSPPPAAADGAAIQLAQSMLATFCAGLLRIYLHPPRFERRLSARPTASAFARHLAAKQPVVVNQLHENVLLSELQRLLLPLLDGCHGREELANASRQAAQQGRLNVDADADPADLVDRMLAETAQQALLVA